MSGAAHGSPDPLLGLRAALCLVIWPLLSGALPTTQPSVETNFSGLSCKSSFGPSNCSRVDRLTVDLPYGNQQFVHVCIPGAGIPLSGKILIICAGHADHYYGYSVYLCLYALQAGHIVVGISMPNMGFNEDATYDLPDGTTLDLTGLHDLNRLETASISSLRFFLEATIQSINYLIATYPGYEISMAGISGGGFTTEFCAAIDARIKCSYPVYGSLPRELRIAQGGPGDNGDWEQAYVRRWWGTVQKHEHIYALGCKEAGRKARKILGFAGNPIDPVFPCATIPDQVAAFERYCQSLVSGSYVVHHDTTSVGHTYSDETVAFILADMAA